MHRTSFIDRPLTVQILTGIVLVLFALTFLRFVSFTFSDEHLHESTYIATDDAASTAAYDRQLMEAKREMRQAIHRLEWSRRKGKQALCGHDEGHEGLRIARHNLQQARLRLLRLQEEHRRAATVEQELRLRAEQFPESDALILNRLGLDHASMAIMR